MSCSHTCPAAVLSVCCFVLLTCPPTAQQRSSPSTFAVWPFDTLISVAPNCLVMLLHAGSVNYPFDEMLIQLPHLVKRLKGAGSPQPQAVSGTASTPVTRHNGEVSRSAQSTQAPENAIGAAAHSDEGQQLSGGQAAHASTLNEHASIVVLCRRGNDSQLVVQSLREHGFHAAVDLTGGLAAWAQHASTDFPMY